MSFDPVPWLVGNGARHSPEISRTLAYAATSGAEGVVAPGDLKVQALAVPGTKVRIAPGACLLLNRSPGARSETYVGRAPTETEVDIVATGSGGGRSDLVIARVEDEQYAPWQNPPVGQEADWPRFRPFVIQGVPPGTMTAEELGLGYPAVELARIDLPASTGTVTGGMVVNLRKLALPRSERQIVMTGFTTEHPVPGVSPDFQDWNLWLPQVRVPKWATHVNVITNITGLQVYDGLHDMAIRTVLIGPSGSSLPSNSTTMDYDNVGQWTREALLINLGGPMPQAMKDALVTIKLQVMNARGSIAARQATQIAHDLQFVEKTV